MKSSLALIFLCGSCLCVPQASAITGNLLHTFDDPTVTNIDVFGASVAVDGHHVLIGASGDDTEGSAVGQAHLFDAITGNLLHTFDDPTVTNADQFGISVAVDGNYVLIGSRFDDTNGSEVGQAHLFDAITGNLLRTFDDPTVTREDQFGTSVAVDGNHVLIGAPFDRTKRLGDGQAHLFDALSGNLLHTFNNPTLASTGRFGTSVAVDGNHVLIGSRLDLSGDNFNVGKAYLFDAMTGTFLHKFEDPTVTSRDQFGTSVALDGNHVLIGAPFDDTNGLDVGQAHLFDTMTGNLLHTFNDPTVTGSDQFGTSVALDGSHVLIGAPFDGTNGRLVGQAHLFDAMTGNFLHTFDDPTVTNADSFGFSVAVNGNQVVIGAFRDDTNGVSVGQAYLFDVIVPEPTSVCLLLGVGLIAGSCRRRSS